MYRSDWNKLVGGENPNKTIRFCAFLKNTFSESFLKNDMNYPKKPNTLFKQYGEIESNRYGRNEGTDFMHGQFKNATAINDLKKKDKIELDDRKFVTKPFYELNHSKDALFKCFKNLKSLFVIHSPPPVDSHENIMEALNDDCLRLIFEKIDNLADIYSVTNVCTRFKSIGKEIFPSIIKRKYIRFDELVHEGDVTLFDIEQFLRDFGPSVISAVCWEHCLESIPNVSNNLLKLIHKYCKNLESLEIHTFSRIEDQTIIETRSLLSKLKHVVFYGTSAESFITFLSACRNVETLKLGGTDIALPIMHFPKLVTLRIQEEIFGYINPMKRRSAPFLTVCTPLLKYKLSN